MAWDAFDFALASTLVAGTGVAYAFEARRTDDAAYRFALGFALATALFLVWMILAVGLIGAEGDPFDLMYGGVLAVGIIGAIIARLRPHGMARALFATALAQAMVAVIALLIGKHRAEASSVSEILIGNGLFVALLLGSAVLFRVAAQEQPRADPGPERGPS